MPLLDVSDAILDPQFCDEIYITRRPYVVDGNGRTVVVPKNVSCIGVITQGNPNPMEQLPDDQVGKSMITVHAYDFQLYDPITGKAAKFQPDLIRYNGNHYIIDRVLNWSKFGAGFTQGVALLYNMSQAQQ